MRPWHSAASSAANPPPPSESPRSPPTSATPRIEHGSDRAGSCCDLANEIWRKRIPTKITPLIFLLLFLHSTDFTTDAPTNARPQHQLVLDERQRFRTCFLSAPTVARGTDAALLLFHFFSVLSCPARPTNQNRVIERSIKCKGTNEHSQTDEPFASDCPVITTTSQITPCKALAAYSLPSLEVLQSQFSTLARSNYLSPRLHNDACAHGPHVGHAHI